MNLTAYYGLTGHHLRDVRENWKGLCPVHDESTPSFFIHRESYLCHCFGCGASGYLDIVLAKAFELSSKEVRDELGIPTTSRLFEHTPSLAQVFSKTWLSAFPLISSHPYLEERGLDRWIIEAHGARWDKRESRIVFPLRHLGGPTIGAAGRTLIDSEKKWYFYWNTKKGEILYSIVHPTSTVIVVEGIFDVIYLNQVGYENVVALLGSSSTKSQIQMLKSIADEVILFLDNDKAGRIGENKLTRQLRSHLRLSYAVYPDERKDPALLSPNDIERAIESRQTYVQYINTN